MSATTTRLKNDAKMINYLMCSLKDFDTQDKTLEESVLTVTNKTKSGSYDLPE